MKLKTTHYLSTFCDRSRSQMLVSLLFILWIRLPGAAQVTKINFDDLDAVSNEIAIRPDRTVPQQFILHHQLRQSHGVTFYSRSNAHSNGVAVVNLEVWPQPGHAQSASNGIASVDRLFQLDYSVGIQLNFYEPGTNWSPGATDFVSIKLDRISQSEANPPPVFMEAYDIDGQLVGRTQVPDLPDSVLTLNMPHMHEVRLLPSGQGVAFDDLRFNPPTPATRSPFILAVQPRSDLIEIPFVYTEGRQFSLNVKTNAASSVWTPVFGDPEVISETRAFFCTPSERYPLAIFRVNTE